MPHSGGWESVREAVRQAVGPSAYGAWFRRLEGSLEGDRLVIRCPDRFTRDWIRSRYGPVIEASAESIRCVEYRVEPNPSGLGGEPTVRGVSGDAAPTVGSPTSSAAASGSVPSFASFKVDAGNALAVEAARAVARGQAGHCSPLFLNGASGVGKTHLCRAIQRELVTDSVYRSSEEFTSEVTSAMRSGRMHEIRHRYRRSANVLILEDVQFLAGKPATQVELFHTIEHLISRGKTVVLSADRAPRDIEKLDEKLTSRMVTGLVARIAPPELETRTAILREKAAGGGIGLPEECLRMLAERPVDSVRDLLAGLNQVVARASLLRQKISPELVAEALAAVDVSSRPRSLGEIIELVAKSCALEREELCGRSRRRRIVQPRQLAMYLCRKYTNASLKDIGRAFDRDHTSVIYAIEVVERRIVERPQLRYELEALAARFNSHPPWGTSSRSTRGTRPT
ncbi:MAG: DnaA/Hda family protein [Myxococcota bacterium]